MTITNHIRRIQELCEVVIQHVDDRKYRDAHHFLDSIETKVHLAHDHVDQLQLHADCAARSAGGD